MHNYTHMPLCVGNKQLKLIPQIADTSRSDVISGQSTIPS